MLKMYFWSIFSEMNVTFMPIGCFIFWLFTENASFSVLRLWHTYVDSRPKRGSKWMNNLLKKWSYFNKRMFFLMFIFRDENRLYANCLFHILIFYRKCLLFQFFSHGIRIHIPILTGVQNEPISCQKTVIFC